MKITSREWNRIWDDYKSERDGKRSMLMYHPMHGTCSVPVQIDDEDGLEMGLYKYDLGCTTWKVHAYNEEDALCVIERNVNLWHVKNLRRVRSLCNPEDEP